MMAGIVEGLNNYKAVYYKLIQKLCLCDHGDSKENIKIFCDLPINFLHNKNNTDEILQKLSLLAYLFEAQHCRWAFVTSKSVLEDALFLDCLVDHLQTEDSLIAFCAGKVIAAATVNHNHHLQADFFKGLVSNIEPLILNHQNGLSRRQVNQIVYTMDTFKHVLHHAGQMEIGNKKTSNTCSCVEGYERNYDDKSHLISKCQSIITEVLPSLTKAFFQMFKSCSEKASLLTTEHRESLIISSKELTKILMAFLELFQEVLRFDLNKSLTKEQIRTSVLHEICDILWLNNLSPVVTKKILDIINSCFDHILDNQNQATKDLVTNHASIVYNVAHRIITQVKGECLGNLTYRDVYLGFGGITIERTGNDVGGDLCSGDYPLLRQLVKLVISAAIMVLQENSSKEAIESIIICLRTISQYITKKMDLQEDTELCSWLFDLFADQDDSLILIMMRTLQLHKLLCNNPKISTTRDSKTELESDDISLFNPHAIFIKFLDTVTFEPNLLLDLLISNETCFLLYLVQYVRCVLADWDFFSSTSRGVKCVSRCNEEGEMENEEDATSKEAINGNQADPISSVRDIRLSDNVANYMEEGLMKLHGEKRGLNDDTNVQVSEEDESAWYKINSTGNCEMEMQLALSAAQTIDDDIDITPVCKKRKRLPDSDGSLSEQPQIDLESPQQCNSQSSKESSSPVKLNPILDETMTVLIRLRYSIEKISANGLFPYNVKPLLRLLEQLEDRYEQ